MRSWGIVLLTLGILPAFAQAGQLDDYIKVRKQHGISQAASVVALDTFVGKRTMEVSGIVRGWIGGSESQLLILENPEGSEIYVRATETPDWLKMGSIKVRMLVSAERETDTSQMKAQFIAAAAEGEVRDWEIKNRVAPKPTPKASPPANRGTLASRGGERPSTNVLTGAIGENSKNLSPEILKVLPAYTDFIANRNKKISRATAQRIAEGVLAYSVHYGVDARLIMAIVMTESGFNPTAKSSAGARGLGQLMPGTAKGLGVANSYDTDQNLYGTVRLIRGHIDKYTKQKDGDSFEGLVLALAAYNAGSGNVRKHGGVPPFKETQNYIRKVMAAYKALCGE